MRAAALLVPLAGAIPQVASFAERRSNPNYAALLARETDKPANEMMPLARGISPAVTAAPKPRYAGVNLFPREVESNTCGFVHYDDDPNSPVYPITCDPAYLCTNVGTMRNCCRSSNCASATFPTACLDSTACPSTGAGTDTICCISSQYPYCVSYLWSTSTNTDEIFTVINCRIDTSNRIGTLQADSTNPGDTSTDTSSTTTTGTTTTPTPTPPPVNDDDDDKPIGPIVGGVVGGVAAIGLAGFAIWFLVRKRKREASGGSPTTQPPPQMQQQQSYNPHQSFQPTQQPPYNPHQSFYGHTPTSPNPNGMYPSPTQSPGPFQAYNPTGSPDPQYSMQSTPPGFMPQTHTPDTSKMGADGVNAMNAEPHPSPGIPASTSPGATGGYQPPQNVHSVQQPGQYVEAPAVNPVGTTGNRAELG